MTLPGPPVYYHIARTLEGRIYHGVYRPGEPIPSEKELCREFGVARLTVREALRLLTAQSLVVPRRGSGTFVADTIRPMRPVNFMGYLEDLVLQPLALDVRVGKITEMRPPERIRGILKLGKNESVVAIERIRSSDGQPVNRAINYVAERIARRLPMQELRTVSLMALLHEYAGIKIVRAAQTFMAEAAPAPVSKILQIPAGAAVLKSEIVLSDSLQPRNVAFVHYHPDRTFFTATLVGLPRTAVSNPPAQPVVNARSGAKRRLAEIA